MPYFHCIKYNLSSQKKINNNNDYSNNKIIIIVIVIILNDNNESSLKHLHNKCRNKSNNYQNMVMVNFRFGKEIGKRWNWCQYLISGDKRKNFVPSFIKLYTCTLF